MDLSFYPLTLEAIDAADAETLALFVAADERPLTGLAGLADWRLSGRLSRMLRSGLVTGFAGEALLTPPGSRLGFKKLFVFGLGPSSQGEEELVAQLADGLRRLGAAGVQDAAMQLPARLSVDLGIRTLIDELQGPRRALVFGPEPAKLVTALSHAAARGAGSAQLERRVVKVAVPMKTPLPVKQLQTQRPPAQMQIPKASPLPFAPSALPGPTITPLPPLQIPRASALWFAPSDAADAPLLRAQQAGPALASALPTAAPASSLPGGGPQAQGALDAIARTAAASSSPSGAVAPLAALPAAPTVASALLLAKTAKAEKPAPVLKPPPPPPVRFVPPPPKPTPFGKGKKGSR